VIVNELVLHTLDLKKAARVVRDVNHTLRQQMLRRLHQKGKMAVSELYVKMRLEQSVASRHLAILRKANLVNADRLEKFICYPVSYKRLDEVHHFASQLIAKDQQ
jgi:DNA-binding transcriptional ArsR family regulator